MHILILMVKFKSFFLSSTQHFLSFCFSKQYNTNYKFKMGQQLTKTPQKSKFGNYLTSFCTKEHLQPQSTKYTAQESCFKHAEVLRKKRMTLIMDRVLLKLTRKNINVKKSYGQWGQTRQIQKHLASRLKEMNGVEFHGKVSDILISSVLNGVRVQPFSKSFTSNQENLILKDQKSDIQPRIYIECLVSFKKKNYLKNITKTLRSNLFHISNYVFVVEDSLQALQYHQLFMAYRQYYMFEVEKVMVMNQCISNIIYVTSNPAFLNIDNQTLSTFLVQKLTQLDPKIDRLKFNKVLQQLLNRNCCVEICCVVGEILSSKIKYNLGGQLINTLKRKCPENLSIIGQLIYLEQSTESDQTSCQEATIHLATPAFNTGIVVE